MVVLGTFKELIPGRVEGALGWDWVGSEVLPPPTHSVMFQSAARRQQDPPTLPWGSLADGTCQPYPLLGVAMGGCAWGVSRRFLKGSIMAWGRPGRSGVAAPYGGAPGGPTCSPAMGILPPGGIPGRCWTTGQQLDSAWPHCHPLGAASSRGCIPGQRRELGMPAGAAASDRKAGTGEAKERREAWPGSTGAKARLVALCHHPQLQQHEDTAGNVPTLGTWWAPLWKAAQDGGAGKSHLLPQEGRR